MLCEVDITRELRRKIRQNDFSVDEHGNNLVELRDIKFQCIYDIMVSANISKEDDYGFTIQKYHEMYDNKIYNTEQIKKCKEALKRSKHTRQAIISFTRTDIDPYPYSCAQYIHYMWKNDNEIDAYVYWRSEDIMRYYLDLHYIQWLSREVIKDRTIKINYIWHVGSFHIYEKYFKYIV